MWRRIRWILGGLGAVGAAYLVLLLYPQPLFRHKVESGNVSLWSDQPIPPQARLYLDTARARLARSPWNDPQLVHRIFVCRTRWRWVLFTLHKRNVGGINCALLNRNIFLRDMNWASGRLIGPSGKEVEGERTLPYYFAHEMAHGLVVHRLGRWRYWRAKSWKHEGFADHLAKTAWNFPLLLGKFKAGDPKMDPAGSGYYWRYHLMVGYLLERKGLTADSLFRGSYPVTDLEQEIRSIEISAP